jgi:RNA polymerase sigma-70 factor (ECF subfamily)
VEQRSQTSLTLLDRLRTGDADAWHRLIDLYAPLVRHWCRRWGVQGADADDVSQDVFQAASQQILKFRRERPGDTFRGWLRGITRHKTLDFWRRRGQQPVAAGGTDTVRLLEAVPEPASDSGDDPADASPIAGVFHRALALIRNDFEERTWQAFWRVTVDGQTTAEAAAALGMTVSAVRMAKSRVMRRLREEIGDIV